MWHWVSDEAKRIKDLVVGYWNNFLGFFRGLPGDIARIASGMWDGILSAFKGIINRVIDVWNDLHFTLPHVDILGVHIGGESIGVPHIPHLAQGGLITQTGLVYAHAGEAITPIEKAGRLGGPAVQIQNATFSSDIDVDAFMRRVAWVSATRGV